jgi:hypothetical protein
MPDNYSKHAYIPVAPSEHFKEIYENLELIPRDH